MNKKLVVILLAALLFIGASGGLAAEESADTDDYEVIDLQQVQSHTTLCGEGNGGGAPG
jgi:hypothetical protein